MIRRVPLVALALATACADPLLHDPSGGSSGGGEPPVVSDLPTLMEACDLDHGGSTLVITTTDFSTGSVTVVDTRNRVVTPDVALATTDSIPFAVGERVYVVSRFGHDFVDVLEPGPTTWPSRGQYAIATDQTSAPNPHSIAIASDGLAYVPLFGAGTVRVMDFDQPPGSATVRDIDLSAFADDDGNPEPSLAIACGDIVFVTIQRLDGAFMPVGPDALVPIDTRRGVALDLDPDRPGGQGIELAGTWLRQLRRDPTDPTGHTLLGLTTGIERIDLSTGAVDWTVTPEVLARAGINHPLLPLSFDTSSDGTAAYLAAYGSNDPTVDCSLDPGRCYDRASLYDVVRDDPSATPRMFATDFDAVDHTLEVLQQELWFGSNRRGNGGLFVFDLEGDAPSQIDGPLSTGLPPYSLTAMELP
jgi:hypothetical protein